MIKVCLNVLKWISVISEVKFKISVVWGNEIKFFLGN